MKLTSLITVGLLLIVGLTQPARAQNSRKEVEAVRRFTQAFYDWYTPIASGKHHEASSDIALRSRSYYFTAHLTRVLREDSAAQSKVTGEIVGLDFDPFMSSQDPDKQYKVGRVRREGKVFWVGAHRVVDGKVDNVVIVSAEVVMVHGKYRFADFYYPHPPAEDLLTILKLLKKDRDETAHDQRSDSSHEKLAQTTHEASVYSDASTHSKILWHLKPYEYVVAFDSPKHGFLPIKLVPDRVGFVHSNLLTLLESKVPLPKEKPPVRIALAMVGKTFLKGNLSLAQKDARFLAQVKANRRIPAKLESQMNLGVPITRLENLQACDRLYFLNGGRTSAALYIGSGYYVTIDPKSSKVCLLQLTISLAKDLIGARRDLD